MKRQRLLVMILVNTLIVCSPVYGFCATMRPVTVHTENAVVLDPQPADAPEALAIYPGYESHEDGMVVINDQGQIMFSPGPEHQLLRSVDNGETWHIVDPSMGDGEGDGALHPWIWRDKDTGRVFYTVYSLLGADECESGGVMGGSKIYISDDFGDTWERVPVGCDRSKDWGKVFTAPPVTEESRAILAANGYPNVVYYCCTGPIFLIGTQNFYYKSLDGGKTFERTGSSPINLYNFAWPQVGQAGPDGTLYVPSTSRSRVTSQLRATVHISKDEGDTWNRVFIPDSHFSIWQFEGGGLFDLSGPTNMLSINLTVDDQGTVYVAWIDDEDLLPYLVYTKDGGNTFSPKIMIGAQGVNTAMLPNINVKKPGYVAVAYYGSFDESDGRPISSGYIIPDRRDYNAYLMVTTDLFAETPVFWSTMVNDPGEPVISGMWWNQSEYLGRPAFAPDHSIWAAYINNRTALAVRMTAPPEQDRPSLR